MPWEVQWRKGLSLPQAGVWLDAQHAVARGVITHAHSDHTGRHKETICSKPTAELLHCRLPGRRVIHALPYGQEQPLTFDTSISLHPAGHILGSSMVRLQNEWGTLLYTGDFKLRRGLAAEPCDPPPADVLVMETTFGLPRYELPPEDEIRAAIIAFCQDAVTDGRVPVLFCYSLGKTQEVLAALKAAALPVMLHPSAMRLTRIYEQCGYQFPGYREFEPRSANGHIVICPPPRHGEGILRHVPARRTAMISGWALDSGAIYRYRCDAAFPLSDHADFPDLLKLVERVNPKRILTVHGFAKEFAGTLRARGWDAWALGRENQLELSLPHSEST